MVCWRRSLVSMAARLWAAPATTLGLMAALAAAVAGARFALLGGVLEVTLRPRGPAIALVLRQLPFSAITFGHVVIACSDVDQCTLRPHERVHVGQYERWGALLLLAYPLEGLLQWLRGRRPYLDNRFEVEARKCSPSR